MRSYDPHRHSNSLLQQRNPRQRTGGQGKTGTHVVCSDLGALSSTAQTASYLLPWNVLQASPLSSHKYLASPSFWSALVSGIFKKKISKVWYKLDTSYSNLGLIFGFCQFIVMWRMPSVKHNKLHKI